MKLAFVGVGNVCLVLGHLALLWIKMARVPGRGAGFVGARLQR